MLKNYIRIACNSLLKNRLFTMINIAGLAIGLATCLLILLYVQDQSAYDKHWRNADQLYRLNTTIDVTGSSANRTGMTAMVAMDVFRDHFSTEVGHASRIYSPGQEIEIDGVRFEEEIQYADPALIHMLDFEVLAGNLESSLADPASIALSAEMSKRFFGTTDSLGRVISIARAIDQTESVYEDFRVAAIYRLPEANSVLSLSSLVRLDEGRLDTFTFNNWMTLDFMTLVQLAQGVDPDALHAQMAAFTDQHVDISPLNPGPGVAPSERMGFDLQNIQSVYLDDTVNDNIEGGNHVVVMAFSAIAALVLLIGCINFTILSTARATQRAKEVAMRKAIGANRRQLVAQFMGESFLIVLPSMVLALVLMELMLPFFEALVGSALDVDYTAASTWLVLGVLLGIVGLVGGCYPALVLSHFRPADTLKANRSAEGRGSISLRNALVVFQFSVSIALIIATAVIYAQVQYSANRDPGFNGDNILVVDNLNRRAEVSALKTALKQEVVSLPGVEQATLSGYPPMQTFGYSTLSMALSVAGNAGTSVRIPTISVDHDFFRTFDIPIVTGRDYDEAMDRPAPMFDGSYQEPESQSNVVINTSAARLLGFDSPQAALGEQFSSGGFNPGRHGFTVVGVVADTQFFSLRATARPEVYVLSPQYMTDVLSIRYADNAGDVHARLEEVWKRLMGDAVLSTSYVDDNMAAVFAQEKLEAQMLVSFSLLAIVIACLGLYGSAAFTVDRRTREIGIRKVMGAQVKEIVALLLWQFSKPVLLANIIAWPVAMCAMLMWLQRFPYQIDALLLVPLCVLAGALALSIAWLTVAGNTLRVATTRPVYALRYE